MTIDGQAGTTAAATSAPWAQIRRRHLLFEDEAVLALNKPAGISVMGERHDTDLVRLAAAEGEELYPVHRIDKVTSGLILFARELRHHGDLTRQFQRRTVDKTYLLLTRTRGLPLTGTIDLPLSVGRKNRVRVAADRATIETTTDSPAAPASVDGSPGVPTRANGASAAAPPGDEPTSDRFSGEGRSGGGGSGGGASSGGLPGDVLPSCGADPDMTAGRWSVPAEAVFGHVRVYPSVTTFKRLWEGGDFTLLAATPVSGRRHQIRVHLAWIGHPIEGDPLFERTVTGRTHLHSWRLAIDSAGADSDERLRLEAAPGADFWALVGALLPPRFSADLPQTLAWSSPLQSSPASSSPASSSPASSSPASSSRRPGRRRPA
uniref:RNA pseudouridylate synthase n=1 Tax=uncultured Frankia sp. TaxID=181582 RepID=A0A6F8M303_9ACTN|nr:ribosomal large subunit pseudouridine synthase A [uncultured Frankia sp.]